MEIGNQIRQRRTASGFSQEELADRLYITRQTLSNWETGKTCPDINSLLRLSAVFHVSLDELVKGDIKTMEETIKKEDIRQMRRSSVIMGVMVVLTIGAYWMATIWESLIAVALYLVCMAALLLCAVRMDQLMKKHNTMTYRQIKAFLNGKRLDELEEKNRKWYREKEDLVIFIIGLLLIISSFIVSALPELLR